MPNPDLWVDPDADPTDHRCPHCGIRLEQIPMPQCPQPTSHEPEGN